MDIVLGVSMAPSTVRMVLVEGENADGVTVDEDDFDVAGAGEMAAASGPNQVISAILGTREGASEGGYQLTSTGVTFSDQAEAAVLRDLLADHKIENVMLVSSFLAAAALAQAVGGAVGYARTALMFLEPQTATLAVVDSADGSIAEVTRHGLSGVDPLAALTELVSGVEGLASRPDGVFVVGSGVDIGGIKHRLETATSLPVSAPEEPASALARGAALASANAPLFASSTQALAYAQAPATGEVHPDALAIGYAYVPHGTADSDLTQDVNPLAYSAVGDETATGYSAVPVADDDVPLDSGLLDFRVDDTDGERRPRLLVMGVSALFVVGVVALLIALAIGIRPTAGSRPNPGGHIVSTKQAAPPPPKVKAPAPASALPKASPPVNAPAPAPAAPAPPPAAPAPPPAAPAPPPPAMPPVQINVPGLPGIGGGGPPVQGPPAHGGWGRGPGFGGGRGRGGGRGWGHGPMGPPIPFLGGGGHHGGGLIPGIPGLPGL